MYASQYFLLVNLAEKDELTQLFNRRFGLDALNYYVSRKAKNTVPFCISLVDVDHFKRVNDQLGHHKGDEVLIKISDYLSKSMRETDISSRWGGEEFLFIFPNVELSQIQQRIETICADMPKHIAIEGWDKTITCSFGLIQVDKNETAESALKRVDDSFIKRKKWSLPSGKRPLKNIPTDCCGLIKQDAKDRKKRLGLFRFRCAYEGNENSFLRVHLQTASVA
ncbi:GGDEF domain-containing protein [Marinomonas pontica]|nr:GGDEF domain-containing protein [Marinomonas pontica]